MQKTFRVDPDLQAYAGFVDLAWTEKMQDAVRGTTLDEAGFDLLRSWRGLSNSRRLPWLMVQVTKEGIDGAVTARTPTPLDALRAVAARISNRAGLAGVRLSDDDRLSLVEAIQEEERDLVRKLEAARAEPGHRIQDRDVWSMLTGNKEFTLAMWMSEVNAYTGVYFAYEDFLVRVLKKMLRRQSLRATALTKEMPAALGNAIAHRCWGDRRIEKARLVRHALVHNGRRLTGDLGKFKGDLQLEDDEIVVLPAHTTELYHLLKDAAMDFAVAALAQNTAP